MRDNFERTRNRHLDFDDGNAAAGHRLSGKEGVFRGRQPDGRNDSDFFAPRVNFFPFHRTESPGRLALSSGPNPTGFYRNRRSTRIKENNAIAKNYTSKDSSTCGSLSPSRAIQTYSVGNKKMLMTSAEISPPTITIANGRCESDPMACDRAAGINP